MSEITETAPSTSPPQSSRTDGRKRLKSSKPSDTAGAESTAPKESTKPPITDAAAKPTVKDTTTPATTAADTTSAPTSTAAPATTAPPASSAKKTVATDKSSRATGSTRGKDPLDQTLKFLSSVRKLEDFWTPFYGKSTIASDKLKARVNVLRQKLAATTNATGVTLGSCATSGVEAIQSAKFTLQSILDTVVKVSPTDKPDPETFKSARATTQRIGKRWAQMRGNAGAAAPTIGAATEGGAGGGGGATTSPSDVVKKAQAAEATGKTGATAPSSKSAKATATTAPPDTTSPPSGGKSTTAPATTAGVATGEFDPAKFDTSVLGFVRQEVRAMLGFSTAKTGQSGKSTTAAAKSTRRPSSSAKPAGTAPPTTGAAKTGESDKASAPKTKTDKREGAKMTKEQMKAYVEKKRARQKAAMAGESTKAETSAAATAA